MNREKTYFVERRIKGYVIAALGFLLAFQTAVAQNTDISQGDRVKISAPSVKPITIKGTILTVENSFLRVSEKDTTFNIPFESIRSLKKSEGEKLAIGRGALIGGFSGALTLGLISMTSNEPCDEDEWCIIEFTDAEAFGIGALIGGLGGMAAGALVGAFITIDRWEKVPIPITVSMNPYQYRYLFAKNRPMLSIRVTF